MKKTTRIGLLTLVLVALLAGSAAAQEGLELELRLVRNFGYGGLGRIQGNFTLKIANPPDDLAQVAFYLDGELMGSAESAPFQIQFHTSEYVPGRHSMSARGELADGSPVTSNTITQEILSGEDAWSETQGILVPLLVGVGLLSLIGLGLPLLLSRKQEFVVGRYGPAGGTICPRCGLPFSRSVLAPNLVVGKLARCPHCGKVAVLARASAARLQEAEERDRASGEGPGGHPPKEDDLRKLLEESRFED